MSNLVIKQNEPLQIERLAAQRQLSSEAKVIQNWQLALVVTIPIVFGLTGIFFNGVSLYGAFYAIVITIINEAFFDPEIHDRKKKAAKIQDQFACDVFSLECSPIRPNDGITQEKIREYYKKHVKKGGDIESLKDWYTNRFGELPIEYERLICQRSDITWDHGLRERFSSLVRYILFSVPILIILVYFIAALCNREFDFIRFVLVINSILPLVIFCLRTYMEHTAATERLKMLVGFSEKLWTQAKNRVIEGAALTMSSRRLQDEIYDHRAASPLIPDWMYWMKRDSDEESLGEITSRRIAEMKAALSH